MKAIDLYRSALALMPNSVEDEPMRAQFLVVLNLLIGECFFIENGLREKSGKVPLATPVAITKNEQTLDLDWRVANALIYGVAGNLYSRDEPVAAAGLLNKYEYERAQLVTCRFEQIIDVYGGGAGVSLPTGI